MLLRSQQVQQRLCLADAGNSSSLLLHHQGLGIQKHHPWQEQHLFHGVSLDLMVIGA